jgi:DNA end-binding protein Ku
MPRSIWNGVISFGMVSIPVKLYTATEDKDEYAKDEHVVMTEEDFEKLPLPSKQTVELAAFVKAEQIDPIYYQKTYYLEPDEKGVKPYVLLMQALKDKDLTGIAKIAVHNKEQLCALRTMDGSLVLETLFYPDEIRETPVEIPEQKFTKAEMKMAHALIDLLEQDFDPAEFQDEYRAALQQVIDAKLEGVEVEAPEVARPAKVTDLMSALKASVAAAKKTRDEEDEEERPRRKKAATG